MPFLVGLQGNFPTMAIEVCSEVSSAGISPRISFSHDLNQTTDSLSIEDHHRRLDSSLLDSDFNFCVGNSFVQELSSADELFANGKIRPIEIKKIEVLMNYQPKPAATASSHPQQNNTTDCDNSEKKLLKEFLSMSLNHEEKLPVSRSFWQFKRSHSLNCDSRGKGLIRSLQFLSRSYSTGSAPSPAKQSMPSKQTQKPRLQKQHSLSSSSSSKSSSSMPSSGSYYSYNPSQKPPQLRKCKSYGNGVRISPILNIPASCISSKTVNLFGFGSLCTGKIKNKKR